MNIQYSNACKEVLVLFNYFLDEDDLSKIPEEQMEHLKKNANDDYTYFVDESKELEEQNISKEAKAIIINLYKKYFATSDEIRKIDEIVCILDKQKSMAKRKKTNAHSFNSLEESLEYQKSKKEDVKINSNESL